MTPSFNQGKFLEDTIRSVLDQEYPSLEYVVVDGNSTDESRDILAKYSDRFHWWICEDDASPEEAINKGFDHTSGEIMAWIGSSDKYLPRAFSMVAWIFDRFPEVQWLTTLYPVQWDGNGRVSGFHYLPPYNRKGFFRGEYLNFGDPTHSRGWIQAESTFWRRSLWEKAGGFLDPAHRASDFDLWARFFRHARLWGVAAPLAGWRLENAQRGRGDERAYHDSAVSILQKHGRYSGNREPNRWLERLFGPPSGPVLIPSESGAGFTKAKLPIEKTYEEVPASLFGLENLADGERMSVPK